MPETYKNCQPLWEYMEGSARLADISHALHELEEVSAKLVYV